MPIIVIGRQENDKEKEGEEGKWKQVPPVQTEIENIKWDSDLFRNANADGRTR